MAGGPDSSGRINSNNEHDRRYDTNDQQYETIEEEVVDVHNNYGSEDHKNDSFRPISKK